MIRINYLIRGQYLYLVLETEAKPVYDDNITLGIRIHNENNEFNIGYILKLDPSLSTWVYDFNSRKYSYPITLLGRLNQVIEMCIPLEEISAGKFLITPYLWDYSTSSSLDWLDKSIEIEH